MSQRSMVPVMIMGAFVLAGAIGLYFILGSEDAPAEPEPTPVAVTTAPPPTAPPRPGSQPTVAPSLPGETAAPAEAEFKEYVVGDTRVRDHRKGDRAPIDIPPSVHPPDGRKIHSNLTHEIGTTLKAMVKDCSGTLAPGAKTASSRLEGQVVIAIKAKQVTVTKAIVQLREVGGEPSAVETVKKCIEEKALTITQTAEENDVESYDINLSYAL